MQSRPLNRTGKACFCTSVGTAYPTSSTLKNGVHNIATQYFFFFKKSLNSIIIVKLILNEIEITKKLRN